MNYNNIEEIVKAHSKAVEDANDVVVNILSQDKRLRDSESLNVATPDDDDDFEEDSSSLVNYIIETNRILYSSIAKGFQKLITGFTFGTGQNFLLFVESEEVLQGNNSTEA